MTFIVLVHLFIMMLSFSINKCSSLKLLRPLCAGTNSAVHLSSTSPPVLKKTGSFVNLLPEIYPAPVHYRKALKKTREIKIDPKIKNLRNANRKLSAQILDALMQGLTKPITQVLKVYQQQIKQLHPFELTVVDLTIIARIKAGQPNLQVLYVLILIATQGNCLTLRNFLLCVGSTCEPQSFT
jgi:hypothetical protein